MQLIDFLKAFELFKDLSDQELQLITNYLHRQVLEKNDHLFRENQPRSAVFLIFEGRVELYKSTPLGEEKRITIFGGKDFLGEGALLDDDPHSTSARALEKTVAFKIDVSDFKRLLQERPEISARILARTARVIARRMRQTTTHVANIAAQYLSGKTRTEHDLLGERQIPFEVYYGIQTLRAVENFNITGISIYHYQILIESLAMVKMAAARANHDLGLLDDHISDAICQTCREIIDGRWHTHFVIDVIQGGAGTSTNMNANEVIANRALEILGHEKGEYQYCHPNNHVNLSQSTNDVYPTALKIALYRSTRKLIGVLKDLIDSFKTKAEEFKDVIKLGRTQLQDAVPMTLGQEMEAYAATLAEEIERLRQNADLFLEINLGGTAIGTGINAHPDYGKKAVEFLREITGIPVKLAPNLVEATQDTGSFVMFSSALKRLSVKLSKIANDLRLLSSGPRAGLNEINLPKMQPGSSIMPGKVNPVIPEVVNQVAYKVIGNDLTVTMAAEAGQLELNVMEPVIAQSLFESIEMLRNGMITFKYRCVDGITANREHCREMVENSISLITALNPVLGYEACSQLAKEALESNKGAYELVLEKGLLSKEELDEYLKPENMLSPRTFTKKRVK
ncbi:MAG: aspartate ammonia-lyase [Calditrichaeota bacterium]|nr:aspartate ammonia-lyase [Calditrichota bacterium]